MLHPSSARALREFSWPGNFRQFEMVLSNLVSFTLVGLVEREHEMQELGAADGRRVDLIPFPVKTVAELLRGFSVSEDGDESAERTLSVRIAPGDSLNAVSCDVERQYLEQLYLASEGSLEQMAEVLLADSGAGRKVQLRMNQLGIKLRVLQRKVRG